MRNLAAKVEEDGWPEFKAGAGCLSSVEQSIARELVAGITAD